MEDNEIKEKLLCILKNKIQDFEKRNDYLSYLETDFGTIELNLNYPVCKDTNDTRSEIVKPKYFWQKEKIITTTGKHRVLDYHTVRVRYQNYSYILTKDEYEELITLKAEKTKEKVLLELDKLCNIKN